MPAPVLGIFLSQAEGVFLSSYYRIYSLRTTSPHYDVHNEFRAGLQPLGHVDNIHSTYKTRWYGGW